MDLNAIPVAVRAGEPTVWINPRLRPAAGALASLPLQWADVAQAVERWRRFSPLLALLFPELATAAGCIESPLLPLTPSLAQRVAGRPGGIYLKADHLLPLTGSVKARGGVYEVLWYAEQVAMAAGLPGDYREFAEAAWRERFAACTLVVGSTGNLGYSVGVMARALGFAAEVHMSSDASAWKKQRLRALGVEVVEHAADYTAAVAAARASAGRRARCHFVDDETSRQLFLGYAASCIELRTQLEGAGVLVDPMHPLTVYLPCGVGGAPGGIAFGLKHVFGDAVHCIFVEPVESPCMLVQLASESIESVSVYDVGRSNRTVQDGLACAAASLLAAAMMRELVSGIVTVTDDQSLEWVRTAWRDSRLRLEPSAAAALAAVAPSMRSTGLRGPPPGTDLIWTTGGGLLPDAVFEDLLATDDDSRIIPSPTGC